MRLSRRFRCLGCFSTTTDPYDTDKMAVEFLQHYIDHAFAVGQCVGSNEDDASFRPISLVTIPIHGQENTHSGCQRHRRYAIEVHWNPPSNVDCSFAAVDLAAVARGQATKAHKIPLGVTLANSMVVFERAEGSSINLAGKSKG